MSISRSTGFVPVKLIFPVTVAPFAASGVNPGAPPELSGAFSAFSVDRLHPPISASPSKLTATTVFRNLILRNIVILDRTYV
jgi:hypothetical protein